jgi:hypothetical protein
MTVWKGSSGPCPHRGTCWRSGLTGELPKSRRSVQNPDDFHPSPVLVTSLNRLARRPNRAELDLPGHIQLGSAGRRPRTRVKTRFPCALGKRFLAWAVFAVNPPFIDRNGAISGFSTFSLEKQHISLDFSCCLWTNQKVQYEPYCSYGLVLPD